MEKNWQKHYPPGVPFDINPDEFSTINALFEYCVEQYKTLDAFSNFGVSMTFQELEEESRRFAAFLQKYYKLRVGDRVAIMLPNLLQYPIVFFGILRAGCTVVNLNPLYTASEVAHLLEYSGAKTVIAFAHSASTLEKAIEGLDIKNIIITELGDRLGFFKKQVANFIVKYVKKMVPAYSLPTAIPYLKALKFSKDFEYQPPDISGQTLAFLQYTGGTTGRPRAAMLSHRNLVANILQCRAWIDDFLDTTGKEVVLGALPLYHIFSLTVCCLTFLSIGGRCLLVTNPRDMKSFIRILSRQKISVFIGLNTLLNGLMHHPDFSKVDFSALKLTVTGGMATQASVAREWKEKTGVMVLQGYGLTEASPLVCINPLDSTEFNGSVGQPLPSTDIDLRDGELCVKGPQVMKGYWQEPEATRDVLTEDGWLKTGDIAKVDEKGFVYIVDRKKDMIVVSGFNVYPNEIEDILSNHPGIQEVAVVGVPSEQTGEAVKAFIVKKDAALTKEAVKSYCHQYLTGYKIPKKIEFRESLPKSSVGKVLRKELK